MKPKTSPVPRAQRARYQRLPLPLLHLTTTPEAMQGLLRALLVERRQAADLVQAFLDGLGEELREVFVLMEIEGMTAPEVAHAVDVGVNTVYSRLRLARERFRREVHRLQAREVRP